MNRRVLLLLSVLVLVAAPGIVGAQATQSRGVDDRRHTEQPSDLQGDPLPLGAIARFGTVRFRQALPITSIAFSPKDAILVSAGGSMTTSEGTIAVWRVPDGKLIATLGVQQEYVVGLSYSPCGRFLASASLTGPVRLWDMTSFKQVGALYGDSDGHTFSAVTYSKSGSLVAAAGPPVWVWDPESRKLLHELKGPKLSVNAICFSPSGRLLAGAGSDDEIFLWDVKTSKLIQTLTGHRSIVNALAFSPDGEVLVAGGYDNCVRSWDVARGAERAVIVRHKGHVTAVAFSPDGKILASADATGRLLFTDIQKISAPTSGSMRGVGSIDAVAFSADGTIVAFGGSGNCIRNWTVVHQKEVSPRTGHSGAITGITITNEGRRLVSCSRDRSIRIWDLGSSRETGILGGHDEAVTCVAVSLTGDKLWSTGFDGYLRTWDLAALKQTAQLREPKWALDAVTQLNSGSVVGILEGAEVVVVDLAKQAVVRRLPTNYSGRATLCYSSIGGLLAYVDAKDRSIVVVRVADWSEVTRLPGTPNPATAVCFSPSGKKLAAGTKFGQCLVWDLDFPTVPIVLQKAGARVFSVDFSPDGRLVATAAEDRRVSVWEVATKRLVCCFFGHADCVNCVRFLPRAGQLVSGSSDCTMLHWSMQEWFTRNAVTCGDPPSDDNRWILLGDADPAVAYKGIWELVTLGDHSVEYLRRRLLPILGYSGIELHRRLKDLGDDSFDVRMAATSDLMRVCEVNEKELIAASKSARSLEVQRRIEAILMSKLATATERLREGRAIVVLEYLESAKSRRFLRELSRGAEVALLTKEAAAAEGRIQSRAKVNGTPGR